MFASVFVLSFFLVSLVVLLSIILNSVLFLHLHFSCNSYCSRLYPLSFQVSYDPGRAVYYFFQLSLSSLLPDTSDPLSVSFYPFFLLFCIRLPCAISFCPDSAAYGFSPFSVQLHSFLAYWFPDVCFSCSLVLVVRILCLYSTIAWSSIVPSAASSMFISSSEPGCQFFFFTI